MRRIEKKYIGLAGVIFVLLSFFINLIAAKWAIVNWIFLIVGIIMVLIFAVIERAKVRQFLTTRSFRYGSNIVFMSIIVFGIIILINVISTIFFLSESQNTRTRQEEYQTNISLFLENYSLNRNIYDIDVTQKIISARED